MKVTNKMMRDKESSIDDMRYDLAEQEAMNMNVSDIINLLVEGCEGLESIPDIEVREEWEDLFGEKS